jgi:hypothetical protein
MVNKEIGNIYQWIKVFTDFENNNKGKMGLVTSGTKISIELIYGQCVCVSTEGVLTQTYISYFIHKEVIVTKFKLYQKYV